MDHTDQDSHALLTRMKVAAACALLHGSLDVDDGVWEWSGHLMRVSDRVRQQCQDIGAARTQRVAESRARRYRAAEAGAALAEVETDARSVAKVVARHAEGQAPDRHKGAEYGGCPPGCLTAGVKRMRGQGERLAAAVDYATAAEWVDVDHDGRLRPGPQIGEVGAP